MARSKLSNLRDHCGMKSATMKSATVLYYLPIHSVSTASVVRFSAKGHRLWFCALTLICEDL